MTKSKETAKSAGEEKNVAQISELVDSDMREFGSYSALSRHVPNVIDGLKPVQRRAVWMCANSEARDRMVKVMSISGLVATIHPHGSAGRSISSMVQGFPFSNNYPLLSGKGTFGTEVVPGGIASERYVEARLSEFCREVLVEGLPLSPLMPTFDGAHDEPLYIESKLPLVLLNPTVSISVGFSVGIPGHSLSEVTACMEKELRGESYVWPEPYWKGWRGHHVWVEELDEDGEKRRRLYTNWGLEKSGKDSWIITGAPHDKTIDKLKDRLSRIEEHPESPLASFDDNSKKSYSVRLIFKRGRCPDSEEEVAAMLGKPVNYRLSYTVLWTDGSIRETSPQEILAEFIRHRREMKKKEISAEISKKTAERSKQSELIRFIEEGWPGAASKKASRLIFISELKDAKFETAEWLADLAIYRTTKEEVEKLKDKVKTLSAAIKALDARLSSKKQIDESLVEEWRSLTARYEEKGSVVRSPRAGRVLSSLPQAMVLDKAPEKAAQAKGADSELGSGVTLSALSFKSADKEKAKGKKGKAAASGKKAGTAGAVQEAARHPSAPADKQAVITGKLSFS